MPLGTHTQNTPLIVMLQNPQHLGQMAWHCEKGIAWIGWRGEEEEEEAGG